MEKFSIYDLLAVILPGAVFLIFINFVINFFQIDFQDFEGLLVFSWQSGFLVSIVLGAILYVLNFYLIQKVKWFYRILHLYTHVTDLYEDMSELHPIMNSTLNKYAKNWYGKDIFLDTNTYKALSEEDKKEIKLKQGEFYDRMYYELDYNGKLSVPKSFQSFYLFFRSLLIATVLSMILSIILLICRWSHFDICYLSPFVLLGLLMILFRWLASWYRSRMVYKMYWQFYLYIQEQTKSK